jgi:hypothetical protein
MDPTLIAWAAGLFEGEGCITKRSGGYDQLKLSMTDFDVVRKFGSIVGVEQYCNKKIYKAHHKPQLEWYCRKRSDIVRILTAFLPFFGNRRAYKALNILDDLELSI